MKKIVIAALAALGVAGLTACATDASVVSENLSKDADQFKINRRIIFYNGITDKYIMTVEGKCSLNVQDKKLDVTCKVGENPDVYKKHFLGLSDNVTWFAEQLDGANVSRFHYKVVFKPDAVIPDVERP